MISERDRRVLEDIERQLRATDPELCERLSRVEGSAGSARRIVDRLVSTRVILGSLVVMIGALLLGLAAPALALFVVVVLALSVRISRMEVHLPESTIPPPFGMPPYGPR